jgi:hypothetical protein
MPSQRIPIKRRRRQPVAAACGILSKKAPKSRLWTAASRLRTANSNQFTKYSFLKNPLFSQLSFSICPALHGDEPKASRLSLACGLREGAGFKARQSSGLSRPRLAPCLQTRANARTTAHGCPLPSRVMLASANKEELFHRCPRLTPCGPHGQR